MWRRAYLFLILVRLYLALSPSYLHPDENFQGPEVIAGRVFSYPVHHTWEFTSENPIRSIFPLWLVYGLPMYTLRLLWEGAGKNAVPPEIAYWTLRILMFALSFVLEDWAVQELVQSVRHRRVAVLLVASSYVTWTYQTHTFSNAIETLAVLWSFVLVSRITGDKDRTSVFGSAVLGFLIVLGVFNRITFPAFLIIPGVQFLAYSNHKPLSLIFVTLSAIITALIAIYVDTSYYAADEPLTLSRLFRTPVIAPWNNLMYNSSTENLANHGIHPRYQHILVNLFHLLGPAYPLLAFNFRKTTLLASSILAVLILSIFPHQEARFLIPAVPLMLSSIRLPRKLSRIWLGGWLLFNALLGALMGVYHQGGVVPMQIHVADLENVSDVFWWKTYSPPIWLLNGNGQNLTTIDLMGMPGEAMVGKLLDVASCEGRSIWQDQPTSKEGVYLVAPASASFLGKYVGLGNGQELELEEIWRYRRHINLDDLDFGEDGVRATLERAVGQRGLVLYKVKRDCSLH